jgi:hypothetical protein
MTAGSHSSNLEAVRVKKMMRMAMAAGVLGASAGLVGGPAAHAVTGCTTLTNASLLQCTFVADASAASYHAESFWSLIDQTTGFTVWIDGANEPTAPLKALPVPLDVGHTYVFQVSEPGFGFIESGV